MHLRLSLANVHQPVLLPTNRPEYLLLRWSYRTVPRELQVLLRHQAEAEQGSGQQPSACHDPDARV